MGAPRHLLPSLYRIDDEMYLIVSRTHLLHGPGRAAVSVTSRISALGIAIDTSAPDDVHTVLGVTLGEEPRSQRPFNRSHEKIRVLAVSHPNRFWYD